MVNNKIKALLTLKNENISSYASYTKRSQANVSNKIKRNSWNANDLIQLANFTNTTLSFIDEKGIPVITFDSEDLKEESS